MKFHDEYEQTQKKENKELFEKMIKNVPWDKSDSTKFMTVVVPSGWFSEEILKRTDKSTD